MIDINDAKQLDERMVRVQARRVAQAYQCAGKVAPPGAAVILAADTDELFERDAEAFRAWCAAKRVECIRTIDFRVSAGLAAMDRHTGRDYVCPTTDRQKRAGAASMLRASFSGRCRAHCASANDMPPTTLHHGGLSRS